MNFSRRIICFAVALGLASVANGQDVMTLKECMQYAVENSAQMKLEKPCARDPRSPVPLTLAVQNSLTL